MNKPNIESFLMYINPDDRDMARGALEVLIKSEREEAVLKGERNRIIMTLREEEREKVVKEVRSALDGRQHELYRIMERPSSSAEERDIAAGCQDCQKRFPTEERILPP